MIQKKYILKCAHWFFVSFFIQQLSYLMSCRQRPCVEIPRCLRIAIILHIIYYVSLYRDLDVRRTPNERPKRKEEQIQTTNTTHQCQYTSKRMAMGRPSPKYVEKQTSPSCSARRRGQFLFFSLSFFFQLFCTGRRTALILMIFSRMCCVLSVFFVDVCFSASQFVFVVDVVVDSGL